MNAKPIALFEVYLGAEMIPGVIIGLVVNAFVAIWALAVSGKK